MTSIWRFGDWNLTKGKLRVGITVTGSFRKSIEEVILEEERAELLQRIISKLPEMQRRRFLLHYEYEMTYKEIGKIEHCSQQSVGRAVTAAREKIKAEMKKYLNA